MSTSANPRVAVRRAYDPPLPTDGTRVLVDRLWPRGVKKADARIDEWLKDVAPSAALRTWYGHDPAKFSEFRSRYAGELAAPPARDAWLHLWQLAKAGPVTLITASKAVDISDAAVLADRLTRSSGADAADADTADADPRERGGDPACWLSQVCPDCGALAERTPDGACPVCGAPRDA